jgi:hypothetical protein
VSGCQVLPLRVGQPNARTGESGRTGRRLGVCSRAEMEWAGCCHHNTCAVFWVNGARWISTANMSSARYCSLLAFFGGPCLPFFGAATARATARPRAGSSVRTAPCPVAPLDAVRIRARYNSDVWRMDGADLQEEKFNKKRSRSQSSVALVLSDEHRASDRGPDGRRRRSRLRRAERDRARSPAFAGDAPRNNSSVNRQGALASRLHLIGYRFHYQRAFTAAVHPCTHPNSWM